MSPIMIDHIRFRSAIVTIASLLDHFLTLNDVVTLKCRSGVTQDHWLWQYSTDRTSSYSSSIVTMTVLSFTVFEIYDTANCRQWPKPCSSIR